MGKQVQLRYDVAYREALPEYRSFEVKVGKTFQCDESEQSETWTRLVSECEDLLEQEIKDKRNKLK